MVTVLETQRYGFILKGRKRHFNNKGLTLAGSTPLFPQFPRFPLRLGFLVEGFFHGVHGVGFCLFGYVYVGFHGLVVGVSCEFHHYLGRDANGEHEADEGFAAAVGADFGVFGPGDVVALAFAEAGDVDGLVEAAEFADFLDVLVEFLVGDDGKGFVAGERLIFVFVQDGLGVGIELDLQAGVGLLGDD